MIQILRIPEYYTERDLSLSYKVDSPIKNWYMSGTNHI